MNNFYFITSLIITLLIHFVLYILNQFDRKKKQEQIMIENAAIILDKLDKIKGDGKMDKDIKKLARYLSQKIDSAKEEILDTIEEFIETIGESVESNEEELETEEDEFNEFEEEEADNIDMDSIDVPPPPKPIPASMDISKRQITTASLQEAKPKKKKKRSLFGLGKNE